MRRFIIISITILLIIIVGILKIASGESGEGNLEDATKVGVLFNGEIDDMGWGQSHYEGISASASKLNLEIIYKESVPFDQSCIDVMQNMIDKGCEIIICNSFNYGEWVSQVAEKNPEIVFLHATGNEEGNNITTYFGRMYQMRYLSGIVAGMQTETNNIGYVAAFPISEVNRGINAFTLGVKSVNPDALVHVMWSESWTDDEANRNVAQTLVDEKNIDIITMHCDSIAPLDVAEESGIWSIGYNIDNSSNYPNSFLTAAVWDWEKFYTPQITKVIQGKYYSGNYWEDSDTGLIKMAPLTDNVKDGIAQVVTEKKEMLDNGEFDVFNGPIVDRDGNLRIGEGENMPDDILLNSFDWYVEGVVIHEK